MTELLNTIDGMLEKAIESEHNLMNVYAQLIRAYERLGNEMFEDVAGLKKPNFFVFIHDEKVHKEELENIKFAVDTQIKNNGERRKKRGKVRKIDVMKMVEINPAITNDHTHWIRNTSVDDAEKIIKFLKLSQEWKDFKILPGTPMGGAKVTVEEAIGMKIVGIYATNDKPIMKEHIRKIKIEEEKWMRRQLNKISASIKVEEMLRV